MKLESSYDQDENLMSEEEVLKDAVLRVEGWKKEFNLGNTIDENSAKELESMFEDTRELLNEIIEYCLDKGFKPVNDTALNLYKNIDNYIEAYELLEDEKSKEVFLEVIKCRLTRNIDCILNIYEEEERQYFDDKIIGKLKDEIFVDVGGYIGDTIEVFLRRCESTRKIYFYEPNTENLIVAKQRLEEYSKSNIDIRFRDVGVSNIEMDVELSKKRSGSRVLHSEIGNGEFETETINLVTLDKDIKECVTFIKMDVEGEEGRVLEGAKTHIQEDNPKLAICVYHKFDDLWQLPLQVERYNSNYKMFLRHYCNYNLSETVLYCVPK